MNAKENSAGGIFLTCKGCGKTIDDRHIQCPHCGEKQIAGRREPAVQSDAARLYHAQIQAGMRGETTGQPVLRRGRAPQSGAAASKAAKKNAADMPRRASERPAKASQSHSGGRSARSMPPSGAQQRPRVHQATGAPRMVRRYEYPSIEPELRSYDTFNWIRLCIVAFVCVLILTVGLYVFLSRTSVGQYWLASMGRDASFEAYHDLGRRLMTEGSISRAVNALEVAQAKEPNHFDVLLDLGKAYQGNNQSDRAEKAYTRAIQFYPKHPEPYRLLINLLLDEDRRVEALQVIELAMAECDEAMFSPMQVQLLPKMPTVAPLGGHFKEEIDIVLDVKDDGATILYSLTGGDPIAEGTVYTPGQKLHLTEENGGMWKLRAVSEKNGMYSKEQVQTYTINKPLPDAPKSRLKSGTYPTVKSVPLYHDAGEMVTIYYTVDGTEPTVQSKKYEEPIQLGIGRTLLRAIAVNEEGKVSPELSIEYKCEGRSQSAMNEKDVIDKLTLYKTTRGDFIKAYGEPQSEQPDGQDVRGTYTKLSYAFGYAVFLDQGDSKEPVLAELSTKSPSFSGPRSTGVGKPMEDVIDAFRNEGREANAAGNRVLYKLDKNRIGLCDRLEGEGQYKISYFLQLDNKQIVELTYYVSGGLVTQMDWFRYDLR